MSKGGLTLNGQGGLSVATNATLDVSGGLLGNTTNAGGFNISGTVVFDGTGTSSSPQLLEAMSQDLGNISAGFSDNFAYNTLELTANTYVELVDNAANSPGNTPEAVYVNTLIVPAGATLNLNGLHLYANTSEIKGTITGGVVSPPTVEWISPSSGNWDVASNWSTGTVPSSNDDVIIDVPGASPTVTISSGSVSVLSITASDPLSITGGSLTVAANSTIGGGLSMTGGSLVANGSGTLLTVTGTTTVSAGSFSAQSGATLSLPQLTTYTNPYGYNDNTYFEATGANSVLSFPALTSLGNLQSTLVFQATQGGRVLDSALTTIASPSQADEYLEIYADGTNSEVDVSGLDSLDVTIGYLRVIDSGTVLDGNLTSLDNMNVTLDGTGTLAIDQWTSFTASSITITGGTYTLDLTNFNSSSAYVDTGANLTFQNLASYANPYGYDADTYFEATGANAVLSFPALTSLGNLQFYLIFQAMQGGQVLAPALTTIGSPSQADECLDTYASGTNSEVDLSGLDSLDVTIGHLTVTDSGTVLDGETSLASTT